MFHFSDQSLANSPRGGARIDIQRISHRYSDSTLVLNDLNLEIKAGEFVSILGPSGCGKSTLLRILAGLEKPSQGTVQCSFPSQSVNPSAEQASRPASMVPHPLHRGFVFQEPRLLPWKSVIENVKVPLQLNRVEGGTAHAAALAIIERVGLTSVLNHFPDQLSGGMKMRVSLARALVLQPSVLLLDEPFAALDEPTRFRFQVDLRDLWQNFKMTVVFVTHSISEAVYLANRVVVLSRAPARILLDEPVADFPHDSPTSPDYQAIRCDSRFVNFVKKLSDTLSTEGM